MRLLCAFPFFLSPEGARNLCAFGKCTSGGCGRNQIIIKTHIHRAKYALQAFACCCGFIYFALFSPLKKQQNKTTILLPYSFLLSSSVFCGVFSLLAHPAKALHHEFPIGKQCPASLKDIAKTYLWKALKQGCTIYAGRQGPPAVQQRLGCNSQHSFFH